MKVLRIKRKFLDSILNRKKELTIRPPKEKFKVGEKVRIDCGRKIIGIARIKDVCVKKIKEITKQELEKDGIKSKNELLELLRKFYKRKFSEEDKVLVIKFEIEKWINKEFYEYWYGNRKINEIASEALKLGGLSPEEKRILLELAKTGSIRKTALRLFGSLKSRGKVRRVLRRALSKLREKTEAS